MMIMTMIMRHTGCMTMRMMMMQRFILSASAVNQMFRFRCWSLVAMTCALRGSWVPPVVPPVVRVADVLVFASLLQGCSTLYLFALLLLLLHLRANQEPPGRICESKDPFRFFFCEWAALSSAVASPESS